MHQSTNEFANLFRGFEDAYGVYNIATTSKTGEKLVGTAATKKGKLTLDLWNDHLMGKSGLGIIPINKDSHCSFGAIDIDEYPLDLMTLNDQIQGLELPLVLCRTKSGGAHLYLFTSEYVKSEHMVHALRTIAAQLGRGGSEIFPRQSKILAERGDIGQWINMPYYSGDHTERYGLDNVGTRLNTREFIKYAVSCQVSSADLQGIENKVSEHLDGGPPCLNRLISTGFPKGTRNNGLMNLGVYAKKVDKDNWEKIVEELNSKHMDPPLTSVEVQGVIKSLKKKEYQYTCHQQPIQSYCDKTLCKKCKFGIGNYDVGMPKLGTLTKIETVPPIWFIDVEGGERLELKTEDLQNAVHFQRRCMEVLNIMPGILKRDDWTGIIQKLMDTVTIVEVPEDSTPRGQLMVHLENFCTNRVQGKGHEELLLGKPWTYQERTYFRMVDFYAYLERYRFDDLPKNYIMLYLRELDIRKGFWNVKGKGVNWVSIPEFKVRQIEEFSIPQQPGEEF